MKKRILSILLVVVMCLTMIPTTAFAADTAAVGDIFEASEDVTDPTVETTEPATEPAEETTEPPTETTEPSTEETEPAPVCDCSTDDASIHATTCAVYVTPENPECYCVEKCTEVNVWCDVCGFDVTACQGGGDEGVPYLNPYDRFLTYLTLQGSTERIPCAFAVNTDTTTVALMAFNASYDASNDTYTSGDIPSTLNFTGTLTVSYDNQEFTVTEIYDCAFQNATNLKTVNFSNSSITTIGAQAFGGCTNLSSLALGNVTTIKSLAFDDCTALKSVTIPSTVTTFAGAFRNCTGLINVGFNGTTRVDAYAFQGCTGLTSVTIPASVQSIAFAAFLDCTSLQKVFIKGADLDIVEAAFYRCNNLERVEFTSGEAPTFDVEDGTSEYTPSFPEQLHQLTVENGTGDGMYAEGQTVTLTANITDDLAGWEVTSGDATVAVGDDGTATLTMGSQSSTVAPIYIYTITYDANGGDSYWLPGNMTAKYGEQIVLPEKDSWMTKENADFQGWMIEGILYQPGDTYTVTGNVTVYAHWLSYFRLWFHTENEIGQIITMYAYEPDYQFTLPECDYAIYEKPEGKNFKAWLVGDVEYKAGETITLTKNAHVYPVWEDAVTGTVTFSPGDELATGSMDSITVEAGATITLPECGFTLNDDTGRFYGWKINGTNYKPGAEYLVTNDVTAEAIWNWGYYTITFDANGGAGSMEPMYTFEMDYHTITLPQCGFTPPEGYRFKGWQVDEYNVALPGRSWQFQYTTTVKAIWELDETVSVDIFWGAMEFTYSDGNWNPETHSYESGWTAVGNTVTVVNNGNVDVKATATYDYFIPSIANWGFEYIWNASEAILTPDGDNKQFTFVLSFVGKPNQYFEKQELGIVHIQISRTD